MEQAFLPWWPAKPREAALSTAPAGTCVQSVRSRPLLSSQNLQHDNRRPATFFGISLGVALAIRFGHAGRPSEFSDITGQILADAIEVHRTLGPGLLESIYTPCLQYELAARKLRFVAQRAVPIVYKGMPMEAGYRIDLVVEDVVVEVKSTAAVLPVHEAQLLTYLSLTGCPVGLLINFNVPRLMDGVKRRLNPKAGATRRDI